MGGSNTKEHIKEATEVSNSSGFHVLEIHIPTTGGGILFLILLLLSILATFICFRRCRRTNRGTILPFHSFYPQLIQQPLQPPQLLQQSTHSLNQPKIKPKEDTQVTESEDVHRIVSNCCHKWAE